MKRIKIAWVILLLSMPLFGMDQGSSSSNENKNYGATENDTKKKEKEIVAEFDEGSIQPLHEQQQKIIYRNKIVYVPTTTTLEMLKQHGFKKASLLHKPKKKTFLSRFIKQTPHDFMQSNESAPVLRGGGFLQESPIDAGSITDMLQNGVTKQDILSGLSEVNNNILDAVQNIIVPVDEKVDGIKKNQLTTKNQLLTEIVRPAITVFSLVIIYFVGKYLKVV